MGVPREPVELQAADGDTRMVGVDSGTDHTGAMASFTAERLDELAGEGLRGFVLKSGSPSCGRSVVVSGSDEPEPGLFARALIERFPHLPVIEETDLAEPDKRDNFVERVFAYDRMMSFFSQERSVGQLVMAHVQVKLQLQAHDPSAHGSLGELFKKAAEVGYEELGTEYLSGLMEALATPATTAGHFGVLKSVFDEVKKEVEPPAQKELARALQDYRQGNVPLAVPLTLLRHYIRLHEHPNMNQQTYLEPGPGELVVRSRV